MPATQILSIKTSFRGFFDCYEVKRTTYKGNRTVRIPKEVVEWSVQNRNMILGVVPTLQVCTAFDTPVLGWRIEKSVFEVDSRTYIGFVFYDNGERVG